MPTTKVAITLDKKTLDRLDWLVKTRLFPNRSKVIQKAVEEKLDRLQKTGWLGNAPSWTLPLKRHPFAYCFSF